MKSNGANVTAGGSIEVSAEIVVPGISGSSIIYSFRTDIRK